MKDEINHVCEPRKPNKIVAKASKCLSILLAGGVINRKSFGDLGIGTNNDSANSYISSLRNERYIPIKSDRQPDGTSNYVMLPSEITRYNDPDLRVQQKEEMRALVEGKREKRFAALLAKKKGGF